MPNRVIRDGILDSERVNKLSWPAEIFYRRLMSVVDDFGRGDGRVAIIRSKLYPLKLDEVSPKDVQKWMQECVDAELIATYTVDQKPYLEIVDFKQSVRIKKAKFPANPHMNADEIICNTPERKPTTETNPIQTKENQKQDIESIETQTTLNHVDQWYIDLPNSSHLESISRRTEIPVNELKTYIPAFKKKLRMEYRNLNEFLDHFKNWVITERKITHINPVEQKTTVSFGKKK